MSSSRDATGIKVNDDKLKDDPVSITRKEKLKKDLQAKMLKGLLQKFFREQVDK